MKAVGYVRVSTPGQVEKHSLDTQRNQIIEYCSRKDFQQVEVYEDAGVSGAKIRREAFERLMEDAAQLKFDAVVCADLTRFGRSATDLHVHVQKLKDLKIEFHCIKGGIAITSEHDAFSNFQFNMLTAVAEFEREMIFIRTHETRDALRTSKRIFVGQLPFGYRWDDKTEEIVQVDHEIKVYQRIVSEYLDLGKSLMDIALQLNKERVPTKRGGKWDAASVSKLFHYTIYKGEIVCNTKFMNAKGKRLGDKPQEDWVYYDAPEAITPSKWNALHARLSSGSTRSGKPSKYGDKFLLQGLLNCGVCGAGLNCIEHSPSKRRYYQCRWRAVPPKTLQLHNHTQCTLPPIPADMLEFLVFHTFKTHLGLNPESVNLIASSVDFDKMIEEKEQTIKRIKTQIADNERAVRNLMKFIKGAPEGFDTPSMYAEHNQCDRALKSLRSEIKEEQVKLETLMQQRDDKELLAEIVRNVAEQVKIIRQLDVLSLRDKQRLLKGMLTGSIIITPVTATPQEQLPEIEVEEFMEKLAVSPVSEMQISTDTLDISIKVPPLRLNRPLLQEIFGEAIYCEKS